MDNVGLAVKVQEIDSRSQSNSHRIKDCEIEIKEIKNEQKAIYKIAHSVENLATSMSALQTDVKEIKSGQQNLNEKVTVLENRPAMEIKRRWDKVIENLIWLFVGGIAVYILTQVLPTIFK